MLAATRDALAAQRRRLVVVTPTLKAAHAATAEVGARAGSAAWLAWQHGWRWDATGTWTSTPTDPAPDGVLQRGDLLLVDLCRYRDYAERDGQRQPAMVRLSA
jgi:hypothetical protein